MSFWLSAPTEILNLIHSYRKHLELVDAFDANAAAWIAPFLDEPDAWEETLEDTYARAHALAHWAVAPIVRQFSPADVPPLLQEFEAKVDRWLGVRLDELFQYMTRAASPARSAQLMICGPMRDEWRQLVRQGSIEAAVGLVWDDHALPGVTEFVEYGHVRNRYVDQVVEFLVQSALMEHYVTNS